MTKCSRCGIEIGVAAMCPTCGAQPSQSVFDKGVTKTAHVTGKVIGKSVDVTETVVRETKPVRGVVKAKDKTKEVAKDLQDK